MRFIFSVPGKRGRPRKKVVAEEVLSEAPPVKKNKRGRPRTIKVEQQDSVDGHDDPLKLSRDESSSSYTKPDENYYEGLHMSTMQVRSLSSLVSCADCGEGVILGVRPTTKGMISEFTVSCQVCGSQKSTNTPNLIRERKRKREKKGLVLQKNENINYAHVAAFLDNGLGYSGLRHYCKYLNARCLNEATFIVYAKQVISDVVAETEDFLQQNARIVRKAFEEHLDPDYTLDLTVGYTTTYHQWGSDFCLVAGAVIELQTGLVLDYDVGNMYCHVCKINAKKIVSMSPPEMTEWFNKHQDTCEIREWCDEIDQDSEEGIKEIDPKYLEAFIAKKIWSRSLVKFGFRYTTLIHESDERIHAELVKAAPYGDIPVIIDNITNCFSRRKSEHARTSFQNKLKAKCPRERVQTKDRIMYVYAMSIPEYNKFAIGSNIKLRELVRRMELEEEDYEYATELTIQASEIIPAIREREMKDERAAALKEIGDAFEVEREGEMEEEEEEEDSQDDPDEEAAAGEEEEEEEEMSESQEIQLMEEEDEEMEDALPPIIKNEAASKSVGGEGGDPIATVVSAPKEKDAEKSSSSSSSSIPQKHIITLVGDKTAEMKIVAESPSSAPAEGKSTVILTARSSSAAGASVVRVSTDKAASSSGGEERSALSTATSDHKKIIVMAGKKPSGAAGAEPAKGNLLKRPLPPEEAARETPKPILGTEIKKVVTSDNKVRVVVVEKQDASEEKRKEASTLDPPDPSTSRKNRKVPQGKTPSENGMEEPKGTSQTKQAEVVKPFRVDFDDD